LLFYREEGGGREERERHREKKKKEGEGVCFLAFFLWGKREWGKEGENDLQFDKKYPGKSEKGGAK